MFLNFDQKARLASAPHDSFLRKLSKKRSFAFSETLTDQERNAMIELGISSMAFFDREIAVHFLMSALSPYANTMNLIGFFQATIYHEVISVFYSRKNLEQNKKEFIRLRWVLSS